MFESKTRRSALVASAVFALTSCGSVGHPLPPLVNIPGPVENFEAWQESDRLVAGWTWPRLNTEGEVLRELEGFELFGLELPPDAPAPLGVAVGDHGRLVAEIAAESLDGAGPGLPVRASRAIDRPGRRMAYAVRALGRGGKPSRWSDVVVVNLIRSPQPPAAPRLRSLGNAIAVTWERAPEASKYVVERQLGDEDEFQALGEPAPTEYLDKNFVWDRPHSYRVRSVVTGAGRPVRGEPSEASTITPTDVFPPATPSGLRAIATPDSVELSWRAGQDDDLAGYRVRRNGQAAHDDLLRVPSFSDRQPQASNRYTVTAVDQSGNESAASEEIEVAR